MAKTKKYKFKIEIGDWSHDGHGICEPYLIESNLTIEEVREAYFKAVKKLGKAWPEKVCADYEDSKICSEDAKKLKELGFDFEGWDNGCYGDDQESEEDPEYYADSDGMAKLTLWFISKGNPDFKYKIISDNIPSLAFYGYDEKKQHIGFIGYGVFSC